MPSEVTDDKLRSIRKKIEGTGNGKVRAWMIVNELEKINVSLDESTIRGRFIAMNEPLSGGPVKPTVTKPEINMPTTSRKHIDNTSAARKFSIPAELEPYIPTKDLFTCYVERDIDKRLAVHYNTGKHPITQGKQGTGKTFAHMFYAYRNGLPFFLYSCYEDFKLRKLFGDKTIQNGSIRFQESLFVKAIQCPSLILFDEINAISNANTYDFHALLQNRELFIKDADDGKGVLYRLHPECRIGFAQNPKSNKYIGGHIKASNFLGRCTYITFPEFKKTEIKKALTIRFPSMQQHDVASFTEFYFAILQLIDQGQIPADISIRQLNNCIDLWLSGLSLRHAIEDGISSIVEAVSQPKAKESFFKIAQGVWKTLMK